MEGEQSSPKKFRSPPYPAIGLGRSIERAQQLYQKALHHTVGLKVLAEAWEYGEKSSAIFANAAALIQFGLLNDDGTGDKRKFTLTDAALRIIKDTDPTSVKRIEAIRAAALRPMIHRELWTRFPSGGAVSDIVLRNYLTLDRGDEGKAPYGDQGAEDAIKVYREAISFAGLTSEHPATGDDAVPAAVTQPEDAPTDPAPAQQNSSTRRVEQRSGERELISGLLSKEAGFRIVVHGHVGPKEIDRMIAKLQLDREILADSEE